MQPDSNPTRLRAEARFLAAWAALRESGAEERESLEALALEPWPQDLQRLASDLAGAARDGRPMGPALRANASALRGWVVSLLDGGGARPDAGLQDRAAKLLGREARGDRSRRALLLGRLALLVEARVGFAEALAAVAKEEREHDEPVLAAALEKLAREKADLGWTALADAREPFTPVERVLLARAREPESLAQVLARLARVERHSAEGSAGAALARVARAAADKARPVRKALEGVFSGLEGALGLDAPKPAPRAGSATATPAPEISITASPVSSSATPASSTPASPSTSPPAAPTAAEQELANKITVKEVRSRGPVKTIGPRAEGEEDEAPPPRPALPARSPLDAPAEDPAASFARERAEQRAMLQKARSNLTLLELESEPDGDSIREVGGDLALLREMLSSARDEEGEALRRELDEVELRFAQWRQGHGE